VIVYSKYHQGGTASRRTKENIMATLTVTLPSDRNEMADLLAAISEDIRNDFTDGWENGIYWTIN
jgi:hypothetical protein